MYTIARIGRYEKDSYGKFAVLSNDGKTWQPNVFAIQCAGCHTTGVDPVKHTFSDYDNLPPVAGNSGKLRSETCQY